MLTQRIITNYVTFRLRDPFWELDAPARRRFIVEAVDALSPAGRAAAWYQVAPARAEYDFFAWLTADCEELEAPDRFMAEIARRLSPLRRLLDVPLTLCGITKPSVYVRQHENPQEINPYDDDRKRYFVVYPFTKTAAWYLKSKDERQGMMTGHIRLGKQYPTIKQLLLYSFGIQDQEFVVSYEMDDLPLFSDLVQALRSTEARVYTLLDTPIIAGMLRSRDALADLFAGPEDAS